MLIECKAPHVQITMETLQQIAQYQKVQQAEYVVITNGLDYHIFNKSSEIITDFPSYS
jgi:hypothetical protein